MALELRWSNYNLAAGNGGVADGSTVAAHAAASLGKFMSTTVVQTAVANNLFDDVDDTECTAGHTDYRVLFVANPTATLETDASLYLWGADVGDETITLACDLEAELHPVDYDAAWQTCLIATTGPTADEDGAPYDEANNPLTYSFSAPTSAAPLSLGQIPAGYCLPIIVKRVVTASAGGMPLATISLEGSSQHLE